MPGGTEAASIRPLGVGGILIVALSVATTAACGASSLAPKTRPEPTAAGQAPPLDTQSLFAAINAIVYSTVRIEGSLRLTDPAGAASPLYRVEILAARSGAMWLRATAGGSSFELACNGVTAQIREQGSEEILSFQAVDLPLADATEPARQVPVYALADALLPAVFPVPGSAAGAFLVRESDAHERRVTWLRPASEGWTTRRRAAVSTFTGRLVWFDSFGDDGERLAHVEYGPWLGNEPYPASVSLGHSSGVVMEVEIATVTAGVSVSAGAFRLRSTSSPW